MLPDETKFTSQASAALGAVNAALYSLLLTQTHALPAMHFAINK